MAFWRLTSGVDRFSGVAAEDNVFLIEHGALSQNDVIAGGSTGLFNDALVAIEAENLSADKFAGVSNIELLYLLSAGASTVRLANNLVANTSRGIFAVLSAAGSDTIDASGVSIMRIAFYAGSGDDALTGGDGNDYFEFGASELTSADHVAGGSGFDYLAISTGGTVSAASLANVSGIEDVLLSDLGNSIALSSAFVAASDNGVMVVQGGAGDDSVDASGVTIGARVAFYAGNGNDAFLGGNGSDYIAFAAEQFTSADHIAGGANFDIIDFSTAGVVSGLTNISGIDEFILNHGGTDLTLSDEVVSGADNGVLVVFDGQGNDTVNAAAALANRVVFAASMGDDRFTGGSGSDVALWSPFNLDASDSFVGGAGFDILQLTSAGTVAASAFVNVSGVDELFLNLGGNSITVSGAAVATSDNQVFVVYDGAGHNTVDASAATLGGRVVFMAIAGDHNSYTGGTGSDFFLFGDANLNSSDVLAGGNGAGTDFLRVTTAASVTAADLANVTQMEVVQLLAGGEIVLTDTLSNAGSLNADGTAAADTIDGSAVASYRLVIDGGGGADTLKGGSGDDQFFLSDTSFAQIDGNGGVDKINLTAAFDRQTFDLTSLAAKITDIEAISLEGSAGAIIALTADDILQINASTKLLYLVGGSDDEFSVSGTYWTLLETNHTNAAVSATHSFNHFQNANGADLYIDTLMPFVIALW